MSDAELVVVDSPEFEIRPVQVAKAVANFDVLALTIKNRIEALELDSMEATEENNKKIKDIRAELNKEKKAIDDQRKMVEAILFREYNEFLKRYNEEIKKVYSDADAKLKEKVEIIDSIRLKAKFDYANEYFAMCKITKPIAFLDSLNDVRMSIGVSTAESQIRKQINEHVDQVWAAMEVMSTYPDDDIETLVEAFIDTRSITDAIKIVNASKIKPEIIEPKTVIPTTPATPVIKTLTVKMKFELSESKYRKLVNLLEENGYEWEPIK